MRLSVIIVNWNVRDLLRDCLRSLLQETSLPADEWEIFVVDNHSMDSSVAMLAEEFPRVRVIANRENRGFGRANNQAFAECHGEFVLLLNPDTIIQDGAVDQLLSKIEQMPDTGALGPRLLNFDHSFQRWTGGAFPNLPNIFCHFLFLNRVLPLSWLPKSLYLEHQPPADTEVGWVSGACMLLRRSSLNGKLFDERFFLYGEDLDLCRRIQRESGGKVVYTPGASIIHLEGKSLEGTSPELQSSKLNGLRLAFAMDHGPISLLLYDVITFTGFVLRYMIYVVASALRLGNVAPSRGKTLRQYLRTSFLTLVRREQPHA